ncbi:unnamed protein product [Brachionus calyciflorus]|uniref:X-ray radiation resistance-associated protein 1 n=1 Tax=Brachionus calyciflorus TaxID=104777 RepID=A0A814EWP3_9BILA|nr:unnamed protein product [Brachionus calyciflorus]
MSNTQTIYNQQNSLYKLQNESSGFITNSFPVRRLVRNAVDYEQGWITAYKADNQKYFDAVLTNKTLEQYEKEESSREKKVPQRRILKKFDFLESTEERNSKNPFLLDGFFLMQLFCVEDPLDLSIADVSDKNLNQIKEDDMLLFENLTEINANENSLNFESFCKFPNLQILNLACNNIKTIRVKHEDFIHLFSLDLSFNNLTPIDVAHLGILKNLKTLKLTGNNLTFLPDTFSKLYVYTRDNKKIVSEKFQSLEELFLDQNQLREEDSFDVLSVLRKLKRLHMNQNNISCIPNLKIFRKNHVFQEFNKSYYKRKNSKTRQKSASQNRKSFIESKSNETMVKDLDRPNSEMNIHNSNTFRNSFILEEEEEDNIEEIANLSSIEETNNKLSNISSEKFDHNFELPFPELVYINLADNQIAEEDDLIAIASWPLLNEVILYGNPIVYNNVGFTPLIKQYLIDRLGMNIHKIRPLKPLKTPIIVPQREHRVVETAIPKVSKVPIETKMLTYYQELLNDQSITDRSNLSSASSVSINSKKKTSDDSFDSGGHIKNDMFKPFKQDKILSSFTEESQYAHDKTEEATAKDFNSFFMTQGADEEAILNLKKINSEKNEQIVSDITKIESSPRIDSRFKNYEILLNIENEDQIKVPKDIGSSVRALKQILDHPTIIRDPMKDLTKQQVPLRKSVKIEKLPNRPINPTTNKLTQVNEVLDSLRERKNIKETNLTDAIIKNENDQEFLRAKKMLDKAQKKYEQIKQESLGRLFSPKAKNNIRFNFERVKTDIEQKFDEENDD